MTHRYHTWIYKLSCHTHNAEQGLIKSVSYSIQRQRGDCTTKNHAHILDSEKQDPEQKYIHSS
jgi:hypothetical protein